MGLGFQDNSKIGYRLTAIKRADPYSKDLPAFIPIQDLE